MALPKSQSAQCKILRHSSSGSSAQQAPAKKMTHYWATGGMFEGVSSSGWLPFQKTCSGFKTAHDEDRKQGLGLSPVPIRTTNMSASKHVNGNQYFSTQDTEKPGIVGESSVKFNYEQGVKFINDQMNDKSMHQSMTVQNGVNYPFTMSLSHVTPKHAERVTILQDNGSVESLLKTSQTSQWHFTISGMHFLERSVDKELGALFDALCTATKEEFK